MKRGSEVDNTNESVPVTGVIPLAQMAGDDDEDTKLLRVMADGAAKYLKCFPWCKKIRSTYFGDGHGGIVGVFLFHIEPSRKGVDEWLWVVFGDVPPAFLVIDQSKTPSQALQSYIGEVSKWVELAKQGRSSQNVIPVYLPATPENAADLESRLKMLQELVVPSFRAAETVRA
jgi:hypothetical protein